jgi:hypothetical protein
MLTTHLPGSRLASRLIPAGVGAEFRSTAAANS